MYLQETFSSNKKSIIEIISGTSGARIIIILVPGLSGPLAKKSTDILTYYPPKHGIKVKLTLTCLKFNCETSFYSLKTDILSTFLQGHVKYSNNKVPKFT